MPVRKISDRQVRLALDESIRLEWRAMHKIRRTRERLKALGRDVFTANAIMCMRRNNLRAMLALRYVARHTK